MKIILLIFQILCFSQIVFGQEDNVIFKLYERNCQTNDTTEFCSIVGDSKGYKFVFPAKEMISYRLKDSLNKAYDTIKESFSSLYGPFVFVKRKGKIMFKDLSKSRKLFDLYNINYRQFLAPELFSSSTDSYNIFTNLLNSDSKVFVGSNIVKCYKYMQEIKAGFDNLYRVIYIGKGNLLPYRIEYYNDKELNKLQSEIFVM